MADAHDSVNAAIDDVDRALQVLRRKKSTQVSSWEEIDFIKATVYSWSRTHRPSVSGALIPLLADEVYGDLLSATGHKTSRSRYLDILKSAKQALVDLRSELLNATDGHAITPPPDFSALAADPQMRDILTRRWNECQLCMGAKAHLAATVMMGGMLEALFVAKANMMTDKRPLFAAKSTPIDKDTNKPLELKKWMLNSFIDVGHDVGWINRSGKDVAAVLRDYRNYVHPEKERSHNVTLGEFDSEMFWEITKSLTKQLLS